MNDGSAMAGYPDDPGEPLLPTFFGFEELGYLRRWRCARLQAAPRWPWRDGAGTAASASHSPPAR